jgi:hypothetical protein
MVITITKEHILQAKLAGACSDVSKFKEGMRLEQVPYSMLTWYSGNVPDIAMSVSIEATRNASIETGLSIIGILPLHTFGNGDGYGDGYGNGDGNGNGYGNGYGNGDGDGYGNGYGNGDGYGYGYGNVDGDGYGYGNGDGDGLEL